MNDVTMNDNNENEYEMKKNCRVTKPENWHKGVVQQTKEGMIGWRGTFWVSHETEMKIERGWSRIDWCWDHDGA